MKDELENLFKKAAEKEEGNFKEEFWETYQTGLASGSFVSKTFGLGKIGLLSLTVIGLLSLSALVFFNGFSQNYFDEKGNLTQLNSSSFANGENENRQESGLNSFKKESYKTIEIEEKDNGKISATNMTNLFAKSYLNGNSESNTNNPKRNINLAKPSNTGSNDNSLNNYGPAKNGGIDLKEIDSKTSNTLSLTSDLGSKKEENPIESIEYKVEKTTNVEAKETSYETNGAIAKQTEILKSKNGLNEGDKPQSIASHSTPFSDEKEIKETQIDKESEEVKEKKEENLVKKEEKLENSNSRRANNKGIKKKRKFWFGGYRKDNLKDIGFISWRVNAKLGISSYSTEPVLILPNGYNLELNLEYRFNSKLSVSQGVGFLSQGIEPHTYPYSFRIIENPESSQSYYEKFYDLRRFQFLDFPLSINWSITEKHRISSGVILDVMVGSNYTLTITDRTPVSGQYGNRISKEKVSNTYLKDAFLRNSYSFHTAYQYNFKRFGLQLMYVHGVTNIIRPGSNIAMIANPKRLQLSMTYKLF